MNNFNSISDLSFDSNEEYEIYDKDINPKAFKPEDNKQ